MYRKTRDLLAIDYSTTEKMAELKALQRRDKSIIDLQRACASLEQLCKETNERRVGVSRCEVEGCRRGMVIVRATPQSEYLNALGITAADKDQTMAFYKYRP